MSMPFVTSLVPVRLRVVQLQHGRMPRYFCLYERRFHHVNELLQVRSASCRSVREDFLDFLLIPSIPTVCSNSL